MTEGNASLKRKRTSDSTQQLQKKLTQITVSLSKETVWNACIEMCSLNDRPFSIMNDSGLRKMLDPILTQLGLTVNNHNVKDGVIEKSKSVISKIKEEVRGKQISLKIDSVTIFNRSFKSSCCRFNFFDKNE